MSCCRRMFIEAIFKNKHTIMKKTLLVIAAVITACVSVNAQKVKQQNNKNFFVALSAGPAIPVSDFGSKNISNESAGLAKTGYNIQMHLGYTLGKNYGLMAEVLYAKHPVDDQVFHNLNATADHWQYYGALIGPSLILPAGEKVKFDVRALAGAQRVNTFAVKYGNTVVVKEDWSTAFALQFGADMRYNISNSVFLFVNGEYNVSKPTFKLQSIEGASETAGQRIDVINLSGGIGLNF